MPSPALDINRFVPRHEKQWQDNGDGSFSAQLYTDAGIVEVFTYKGGQHGKPFTSLQMFVHPHIYHARLPRCYHPRWLMRLATDFAFQCSQKVEE